MFSNCEVWHGEGRRRKSLEGTSISRSRHGEGRRRKSLEGTSISRSR
ncbi:hypothetical protein HanXRQr2_Chr04g0176881 [Helianthus annuus]|uniref:Uncharacterized protein n=1 Tax=Helianthus annuus TaxID=4232 RepID=A0A9K3J8Z0_HELAN|nr:hypothetical protein HanXRQr2_Chr04g0176881 [Helianthus annuus]